MLGDVLAGCVFSVIVPQQSALILASSVLVAGVKGVMEMRKRRESCQVTDKDGASITFSSSSVVAPVELYWKDLIVTLEKRKGKGGKRGEDGNGTKKVLFRGSGVAKPGRLLAIMGPSGAGKTTLLTALARKIPIGEGIHVQGKVLVNGAPLRDAEYSYGFVRQESLFFSHLTVRETIELAAKMQLSGLKPSECHQAAEFLMTQMGLTKCADTIVGNEKSRGISGGEKKRLNIACELISAPSLVFADEPTTGLDSFQAEKVMESLKKLTEQGHTVVCTIHQPRSSIFSMMDDLVLLTEGEVVYSGPADQALQHFSTLGYPCPELTNPAEFFSDLIAIDHVSQDTEAASIKKIEKLRSGFSFTETPRDLGPMNQVRRPLTPKIGWLRQFQLLFSRAWKQIIRDKKNNMARLIPSIMSALLFGSIYWKLKLTQSAAMDRMGLLQVSAINSAMLSLVKTLYVFPNERTIVNSERAKGSYGVLPYLTSKLAAELPVAAVFPALFGTIVYPMAGLHRGWRKFGAFISTVILNSFACASFGLTIGATAPSTEAAVAFGPASMVLFIVFGGYYINELNVPKLLRFLPEISIIRWTFEGLCLNEFRGLKFKTEKPWDAKDGEMFLDRLSFNGDCLALTMLSQIRFLLTNYLLTYSVLRLKKAKFVEIDDSPANLSEAGPVDLLNPREDQGSQA